MLKAHIVIVNY